MAQNQENLTQEEIKAYFSTEKNEIYNPKNGKKPSLKKEIKLKKARNYLLTTFSVEDFDDLKEYLMHFKSLKYMVASKEICPQTSAEHIHIFCQYNVPVCFSVKKLNKAHVDVCKGTPEQNDAYVRKDGNIIFEYGEMKKNKPSNISELLNADETSLKELPICYYKTFIQEITRRNDSLFVEKAFKKDFKVFYIWGPSGIGKSLYAYTKMKELGYIKYNLVSYHNGFWIGVGDEEVALYDDWRDSDMPTSEFIKFIDYNVQKMNIKNGYRQNNYKTIFITSIQNPKHIYCNKPEEERTQWLRRMAVIDLSVQNGVDSLFNNIHD